MLDINENLLITKILLMFMLFAGTLAAQPVTMRGTVIDSVTKIFLPGANIVLVETSIGTASDKEGKFIIKNIPPGTYQVKVSYVGYKTTEFEVTLKANRVLEIVIKLITSSVEGKTVTVTSEAIGQNEAINRQLSSEQIKNVVSSERIQKLPDMNAADAATRLPGVSLIRSGGEGEEIVIRGLAPQYNQVTIDGIQLPPNVAVNGEYTQSTLAGDRSTNLSMISSGILGGVEVIKAITPDMDAAVFGGVVNFDLKKAAADSSNLPSLELITQGGYNDLKNNYNNYRLSGIYQQRFFSQKLGLFLEGSIEMRNPGGNTLDAHYQLHDKFHGDQGTPDITSLFLYDYTSKNEREDLTAVLDYKYSTGEIDFKNLFSRYDVKRVDRGETIYPSESYLMYKALDIRDKLNSIVNILSIKQEIPLFNVDLKLAHAYSESLNPRNLSISFFQYSPFNYFSKLTPEVLSSQINPSEFPAWYNGLADSSMYVRDRALTAALDINSNCFSSNLFAVNIKFGGMYQYRKRSYDFNEWFMSPSWGSVAQVLSSYWGSQNSNYSPAISNFIDKTYSFGNFFNGNYSIFYPVDVNLMNAIYNLTLPPSLDPYEKFYSTIPDYHGTENRSAGYIMAKLDFKNLVTILPGIRYQNLTTSYFGYRTEITDSWEFRYKTVTKTVSNGYWLPMIHLIYKPFPWLQLHFAYTNTLNYPPYSTISPSYTINNPSSSITYNNYNLKPATSENYDLVFSFFNNEIGLLTLDGFKKRIKNLVFSNQTFVTNLSAYTDLPQNRHQLFTLDTYINNPFPIDVWGIETEWQTHFWYLPQPFSWIEFSINYSHIFSQATYPKNELRIDYNEDGSYKMYIINPYYKARLLDQPNDILNSSFGINYKGFSGTVSLVYFNNIFEYADFWLQNRIISDKYVRWDLSFRQMLPWFNILLFLDLINLTGANETALNQRTYYPVSIDRYGMFGNLGAKINF